MSEDVKQTEAMLRLMFGDHYVSMFHVIDDDMIRKPVFQSQKIKSYENGDSVFKVTVNWRLLNKLRKELCGEEGMTKHQWVEQAKKEARRNLTGEDLEKCFKALEAWERNTQTE